MLTKESLELMVRRLDWIIQQLFGLLNELINELTPVRPSQLTVKLVDHMHEHLADHFFKVVVMVIKVQLVGLLLMMSARRFQMKEAAQAEAMEIDS